MKIYMLLKLIASFTADKWTWLVLLWTYTRIGQKSDCSYSSFRQTIEWLVSMGFVFMRLFVTKSLEYIHESEWETKEKKTVYVCVRKNEWNRECQSRNEQWEEPVLPTVQYKYSFGMLWSTFHWWTLWVKVNI